MHKAKERFARIEQRHLIAACVIVIAIAAGIVATTIALVANTQNTPPTTDGGVFSVSGEMVCLPHKGNGDVQTMECAYGLRTDDNRHYGLQYDPFPHDEIKIGQRVSVRGALTTANDSKYDIVGTIKVTEFTQP
jgi:hypothetical protein